MGSWFGKVFFEEVSHSHALSIIFEFHIATGRHRRLKQQKEHSHLKWCQESVCLLLFKKTFFFSWVYKLRCKDDGSKWYMFVNKFMQCCCLKTAWAVSTSPNVDHASCREPKVHTSKCGILKCGSIQWNNVLCDFEWASQCFFLINFGLIGLKHYLKRLIGHVPFRGGAHKNPTFSSGGWSRKLLLMLSKTRHSLTHSLTVHAKCMSKLHVIFNTCTKSRNRPLECLMPHNHQHSLFFVAAAAAAATDQCRLGCGLSVPY